MDCESQKMVGNILCVHTSFWGEDSISLSHLRGSWCPSPNTKTSWSEGCWAILGKSCNLSGFSENYLLWRCAWALSEWQILSKSCQWMKWTKWRPLSHLACIPWGILHQALVSALGLNPVLASRVQSLVVRWTQWRLQEFRTLLSLLFQSTPS